jgi:aspartate kinase
MSLNWKNLIQNTAISLCVEDKFDNFNELNAILSKKIQSRLQPNVTLYTIRHFNDSAAETVEKEKSGFKTDQYWNYANCD